MTNKKFSYDTYQEKLTKLNEQLNKVEEVMNIDVFKKEVDTLLNDVSEKESGKTEVDYTVFVKRIDDLTKKFNKEYTKLYELVVLSNEVNNSIDEMNEKNSKEITDKTGNIISRLSKLKMKDQETANKAIEGISRVLYRSMLNESVIDKNKTTRYLSIARSNILNKYVNVNIRTAYDYIKSFVREDAVNLPYGVHDLEAMKDRSYVFREEMMEKLIKDIAQMSLKEKSEEYIDRKMTATMELYHKYDEINELKNKIEEQKKERKAVVKDLRVYRTLLASYVLVPIIATAALSYFGGNIIKEHKTTTKVYDAVTDTKIQEDYVGYHLATNYKMSILKRGEWQENKYGPGYIRYVEEYEFNSDKEAEDITVQDVMKSINLKKGYTETVLTLPEDIKDTAEIIVTETIQDRTDSKNGFLGYLGGAVVGVILYCVWFGFFNGREMGSDLIDDIRDFKEKISGNLKWKVIKEKCHTLGEKNVKFKEEYQVAVDEYGLANNITPEVFEEAKRYIYKK